MCNIPPQPSLCFVLFQRVCKDRFCHASLTKPLWRLKHSVLVCKYPAVGQTLCFGEQDFFFPERMDGTRNLHLPFPYRFPAHCCWETGRDFPSSLFLPSYKKETLSTESPSALYIIISWVLKNFRRIVTFVWSFSLSQSLLTAGSLMPYPGLFVRVFFSLMSSAAVVRFVLLGFFGFNFLPNSLEPLWHNRNNRLEISGQTLNFMAPYLSRKWKTFRGCTEPAPESHEIFWALVGKILMI